MDVRTNTEFSVPTGSTTSEDPNIQAAASIGFPEALTPRAFTELENRFAWWKQTYQLDVKITPHLAAEALPFLDPLTSPVRGIGLTSVGLRDSLWGQLPKELWKPTLIGSMCLYRGMSDVKGAIEANPFCLPPGPFLMQVIAADSAADKDTKEMAYVCFLTLQSPKNVELRRFPITEDLRKSLVENLRQHVAQFDMTPAARNTIYTLHIRDSELALAA